MSLNLHDLAFLSRSSTAFDPRTISGLVAWFKADAITGLADGANLAVGVGWQDSSGAGNHLTVFQNQPKYQTAEQNGLPGVAFEGGVSAERIYRATVIGSSVNYTVFSVHRIAVAASQTTRSFHNGTSSGGYALNTVTGNRVVTHVGVASCTDAASTTNTELWIGTRRSSTPLARFFLNGALTTITNSGSNCVAPAGECGIGNIGASSVKIFVFETLFYDRELTDGERVQVEVYLNQKYAVF